MKIKLKRLRQLVREELLREYPAGIGLVSPVDPDGAYDYDYDIFDHGILTPGEKPYSAVGVIRPEDPALFLGMKWDSDDTCTVHPAAMGKQGVEARGNDVDVKSPDEIPDDGNVE